MENYNTSQASYSSSPNSEEERTDLHVDMQGGTLNCTEDEFAREPWRYCRDAPNVYLGLRYNKRDEFLAELSKNEPTKRNRVQHEIERLRQLQVNFSSYSNKQQVLDDLYKARQQWKHEVSIRLGEYEKRLSQNRNELPRQKARWDRDEKLLKRLRMRQHQPSAEEDMPPVQEAELYGLKACAIYFKKNETGSETEWIGHTHDNPKLSGVFPNQKITVHDILNDPEESPLAQPCAADQIRWFHFPTNNMRWIEKAIGRYYNEDIDQIDDFKAHKDMTSAERVLAREFWRGQMHGSGHGPATKLKGPLHARHMRSRCSIIPRCYKSQSSIKARPNMPAEPTALDANNHARDGHNIALFLPYLHWELSSRRAKMVEVVNEVSCKNNPRKQDRIASVAYQLEKQRKYSPLGKYLLAAARVADEMDYEADERLLRENLNAEPPLHIRRTLDQYYFLTLEDTSKRDRDQVVYRGTRAGNSFHNKNTRVVMVDQLWLWILDNNTIITSFPRRWGRNKPDPSGIHKSLRERLGHSSSVNSIHHLAMIIVDQCSRVFFDRTKPLDERPELFDLFNSAIGHVTELTSVAYETFWANTALSTSSPLFANQESIGHRYLDINPEGTLLREAQDIAEELRIMLRIYKEQYNVVRDYRRFLGHRNGEVRTPVNEAAIISHLVEALRSQNSGKDTSGRAYNGNGGTAHRTHSHGPRAGDLVLEEAIEEAEMLLEQIQNRQLEIQDLEDLAMRACRQLEGLLSLKQQQASILEAKAALRTADQGVNQNRVIVVFTIVTIFFLPLGFFAAFFGMNNDQTGQDWMTLYDQIHYMFGLSAIVILISVSIAFSSWARSVGAYFIYVPLELFLEYTRLHEIWYRCKLDSTNFERRISKRMEPVLKRRERRDHELRGFEKNAVELEKERTEQVVSTAGYASPSLPYDGKSVEERRLDRVPEDDEFSPSKSWRRWTQFTRRRVSGGTRVPEPA